MSTPHKHAALIKQWADDTNLHVWLWDGFNWVPPLNRHSPLWMESVPHAVGLKPTQPPRKMCSLAGVEFPAPETARPHREQRYYGVNPTGFPSQYSWGSTEADEEALDNGLIHLTREAAELHSKALLAANKQAIEGAK